MRCPKCHYISFGSVDRCRNCGYEFSLAPEPQPVDLPIQSQEQPVGPLRDLKLGDSSALARAASSASPAAGADADRSGTSSARLDLPLFTDRAPHDDSPLISAGASPRQPLSVRRAPPAPPKPRFEATAAAPVLERHEPLLESEPLLELDAQDTQDDHAEQSRERRRHDEEFRNLRASIQRRSNRSQAAEDLVVASTVSRFLAGLIDVAIIAAIDAGVVFATLRVLGLGTEHIVLLPRMPLALFLVLLNGGYLATFTAAGGQTIGKMLAGIRVVAARPSDDQGFDRYTTRVSLGAAVLRAAAYLASLLPAGLGFAAILLDQDGRALHDRLAETRVVRV
jgi:uncharacterized RDD family membrane protein YckC